MGSLRRKRSGHLLGASSAWARDSPWRMILLRLVAGSASFVVVSLPKLTVIACLPAAADADVVCAFQHSRVAVE